MTITGDDRSYHVFFKVTFQSNVDVDIDLNPSVTGTIFGLDPTLFYGMIGGIGVVVAATGGLAYRARKRSTARHAGK